MDGFDAFGVNWVDVGFFFENTTKTNSLQLVLIERTDLGAGNFDIEFNYDRIEWETGDASDGVDGLGGFSARVGYSNGVDESFEFAGSAVNGAFLDTGPLATSLIANSLNSTVDGRYVIQIREGVIITPPDHVIPVPGAVLLMGSAIAGFAARRRSQKSSTVNS